MSETVVKEANLQVMGEVWLYPKELSEVGVVRGNQHTLLF
jgi:hypothetical protein